MGVGINDMNYPINQTINGRQKMCPFYARWVGILERCSSDFILEHPTYFTCDIADNWVLLSGFRSWMESQQYERLHLDKDILVQGNKLYSEGTCAFVPQYVNKVLLTRDRDRGVNGLGVCKVGPSVKGGPERKRPYTSNVNNGYGKIIRLGYYETPMEAHHVWQLGKADVILDVIERYKKEDCYRQDVANGLYLRVDQLRSSNENKQETKFL
jgi:hypothetical protein